MQRLFLEKKVGKAYIGGKVFQYARLGESIYLNHTKLKAGYPCILVPNPWVGPK